MASSNNSQSETPASNRKVDVCAAKHQYEFFCKECNLVFCGGCWVRKHRGELRTHEELELNEAIVRNKKEIADLIATLNELSESVETAIGQVTREMQELQDHLGAFCAEVKRQLKNEAKEQCLLELQTVSIEIATSRREGNRDIPKDPVDAISAQRSLFEKLRATNEEVRRTLDGAKKSKSADFIDALEAALAKLKQISIKSMQCELLYILVRPYWNVLYFEMALLKVLLFTSTNKFVGSIIVSSMATKISAK